jgi:hypothetical protein
MSFMSEPTGDQVMISKMVREMRKTTSVELVQKLGEPYTIQDLSAYLKLLEQEKLLNRVQENPLTCELSILSLVRMGFLPEKAKKLFRQYPQKSASIFTRVERTSLQRSRFVTFQTSGRRSKKWM